jgi:hypothetical protein
VNLGRPFTEIVDVGSFTSIAEIYWLAAFLTWKGEAMKKTVIALIAVTSIGVPR